MMRTIPMILLSVLLIISITNAYHILVVFPFPGKSHGILGEGHVKRLLEGGHEVTLITPFPSKKNIPKLHEIVVPEILEDMPMDQLNIEMILKNKGAPVNPSDILNLMINVSNLTFYNPDVQILLRDRTKKFDAVIVEWIFSEILAGFAAVFEAPLIMFTSTVPHAASLKLIDEYTNPAYVPSIFSASVPPFSFVERLKELAYQVFTVVLKEFVLESRETEFYDKTFGKLITEQGRKPIPFMELIYSSAIMLGNSHVSLGGSMRLPQSYKPIAGYHIDPVVKPLPEDLQKHMDSAKNGVIYFSLGSNLKSKDMPDSIKQGLLKTFGALKYNVLWKFEEVLPNLPSNVRIIQWAPQPSILAHPKCILFITHGGLLSTTETVHYGVPIIGIPVFGDQFINVDRAVAKGFAYKVPLTYSLPDELKVGIEEILGNPSYAKRAKELSFIYHDRPASPGKELVHWVEHVIKTGGAPHLRSPALLVPWYQKWYLDLLAIVLIALYLLKLVIKKLCCRSQSKIQRKKKQN